MEWNGSVLAYMLVVSRICVYTYVCSRNDDGICICACTRARALCTRRAVSHRAGSMGLGAGAVGQRRSTPVRLFFRSRAFDLR